MTQHILSWFFFLNPPIVSSMQSSAEKSAVGTLNNPAAMNIREILGPSYAPKQKTQCFSSATMFSSIASLNSSL